MGDSCQQERRGLAPKLNEPQLLPLTESPGVSLITQILYAVVFCSRYLDLFWSNPKHLPWNFVLKLFYIGSSFYIISIMTQAFARTREKERAWKLGGFSLGVSAAAAPLVLLVFRSWHPHYRFHEVMWTFSEILESICVLPQLVLLRQTSVPTVIDSFYLVTLGSYRGFYVLNWIVRFVGKERHFEPITTIFGIIQTAFYVDFAWVYWTRQRVKLRNGGVVDSDDLGRGWLVSSLAGRNGVDEEETAGNGPPPNVNGRSSFGRVGGKWGAREFSISADETLVESERRPEG
ncbi:MAG: hypothetical protein Q9170_003529 [Blastenia crenularia]